MELRGVTTPMRMIMSKAALIKPALRHQEAFFVVYTEVGTQGIEYAASCLSVHLCANKHPPESFYLCNFVCGGKKRRGEQ